jgi:hypothetical protein
MAMAGGLDPKVTMEETMVEVMVMEGVWDPVVAMEKTEVVVMVLGVIVYAPVVVLK